jgi:hypothetical protein
MRLSEKLLQQQRVELDIAPLRTAIRQLRQALERDDRRVKPYAESLAKRPPIAVATLDRGEDGAKITVKPARGLILFLKQAQRAACRQRNTAR